MNELMNTLNVASLAVSGLMLVIGLVVWFFVNRASVRASEQVALLEALLEQQKRQNALLRRLCEASEPEKEAPALVQDDNDEELVRLVAER
jgi:type II secretory pathway pseudopilin PulG